MAISLIKTQSIPFFHNSPHKNSSNHIPPIYLILLLTILATLLSLITYFTLFTKCFSNFHQFNPLRLISSILRSQPQQHNEQDPFISLFSPTVVAWNRPGGHGSGLNESIIRQIPSYQFTITEETIVDQSVYCCMVCLTKFHEQDMLKILPNCNHIFHLDCIDIWLQSNSNCPLCRSRISGDTTNFKPLFDQIIAPSSSPQDSQILSNMDSEEDFVVIELSEDHHHHQERNHNDSRERRSIVENFLKPRKIFHHVSIMGDECIDVRKKNKDEEFFVQPIRRSFSMDSANDRQVYLDVQAMIQQQKRQIKINEASGSEDCNGIKGRRSFFPFCYGKGIKNSVLPLENYV